MRSYCIYAIISEVAEFPSNPPLPDEAPPPPPPPPMLPPPPLDVPPPPPATDDKPESSDDIEVIEVIKIGDIPIPVTDLTNSDEDNVCYAFDLALIFQ